MDALTTTVVGSRRPFTLQVPLQPHHTEQPSGLSPPDIATAIPPSVSRIKRKQVRTFQSPPFRGGNDLRIEMSGLTTHTAMLDSSSTTSSSNSDKQNLYARGRSSGDRRAGPPLPLYHPKGHLALSLPALDPALFGISAPVNIDDHDVRGHASLLDPDGSRRSSSRARRPAAKLREVGTGAGEDDESHDVPSVNGRKAQVVDTNGQARSASPRKRRTAGAGGAGPGGKRKRKEVEDGDGTYPNPVSRRTRNPRGVAASVASPLAGPVLAADADPDAADAEVDGDDGQADQAEAQLPRTTRNRRSRVPAPKRRNSSASETTTTSVSVSIAANTRNTRGTAAKSQTESENAPDAEHSVSSANPGANIDEKEPSSVSQPVSTSGPGDQSSIDASLEAVQGQGTEDVPMDTDVQPEEKQQSSAKDKAEQIVSRVDKEQTSIDEPRIESPKETPSVVKTNDSISTPATADAAKPSSTPFDSADVKMDIDSSNKDEPPAKGVTETLKLSGLFTQNKSPPSEPTRSAHIQKPQRPVVTVPPQSKKPVDDEKEEGELSEESTTPRP